MTVEEAAAEIRELAALRPRGGGTKLGWSPAGEAGAVDFDTTRLNRILEHNEGDFTAVLEAGVPLVEAQAAFGAAGQMLALDPPLGAGDAATIGGIIAANDAGPLRHRFGTVRDLVVGVTVVLSDGTIAKSGGQVIKNVAGYDLGKLFAGSFGTLGLIARVAVRLHPAPARTATVVAETGDPAALGAAALKLAALPLEADCLDADWEGDRGRLTIRFAGTTAVDRADGGGAARRARRDADRRRRPRAVGPAAGPPASAGGHGRQGGRPPDGPAGGDRRRARRRRHRRLARRPRASPTWPAPTSPRSARRWRRAPARCSTAPTACRTRGRPSTPGR